MKRGFQGGMELGAFISAIHALVRAIIYENIYIERGVNLK